MKKMRILILSLFIVIMLSITIFADEKSSSSNLFLFGEDVSSAEKVGGDIYAFAQDIDVSNVVNGDVISFGQKINIKADRVLGNIRSAGQSIDIDVKNTKNITVAGQDITIYEDTVANAIYAAGQNIEFSGTTNDLSLAGSNVLIDGAVNGNLEIRGEYITLGENAKVDGNITIKSENEPTVKGSVAWKDIDYEKINHKSNYEKENSGLFSKIMNIISSVIVAVIMFVLGKSYFSSLEKSINMNLGKFILIGLALLIGIPVCILTLFMTVIGIPIALMLLGIYICVIYLAPMFTGILLGNVILNKKNKYLQVICGVILIKLILMLPYLGTILGFGCTMIMLGSLFSSLVNYFKLRAR